MEAQNFDTFETPNQFNYSAVPMDELGAMEYTIVNILVDTTGSVFEFKDEMEEGIKKIINNLQRHPKSENLLLRVATFDSYKGIREIHGFTPIGSVDTTKYELDPNGGTPLHDATQDSIETTKDYAVNLMASGNIDCLNTIYFVLTDGDENSSNTADLKSIKNAMDEIRRSKDLESTMSILIGVNAGECSNYLNEFHRKASFNHYLKIDDIDKLSDFIENAVSSTSMVLGTGQAASLNI
ncbi:MAG: VWA domain-containing protein [PVC group bacterium]|nr:VWA domain-containing protein [PVC group bacterium]